MVALLVAGLLTLFVLVRSARQDQLGYVGVIGSGEIPYGRLVDTGVTRITLGVAWDRFEPRPGEVDEVYADEVRRRYDQMRSAGLAVVLDSGLQYPPAWLFSAGDSSRFVNQYGDVWHGDAGADVADAVFDPAVRRAQAHYLRLLARAFADRPFRAIRVGGLWNNELHYPPATFNGHRNSFWAFGTRARTGSPVPGYVPGSGTARESLEFLQWYLSSVNRYALWLAERYDADFGDAPTLQMMLPSWGVRPGEIRAGAAGRLDGSSRGELTGALNEGLDWSGLVRDAVRRRDDIELYTTWLDAPNQGSDTTYESPVRYLVRIGRPDGLAISGENTGDGSSADLRLVLGEVAALRLDGLMWMSGAQLEDGRYATLTDLRRGIRAQRRTASAWG